MSIATPPYPPPSLSPEFDEDDPRYQVRLLSWRLDVVVREKEALERREDELEKRIAEMEKTFQRGAGIVIAIPIIGSVVGLLLAYGKVIFAPWMSK